MLILTRLPVQMCVKVVADRLESQIRKTLTTISCTRVLRCKTLKTVQVTRLRGQVYHQEPILLRQYILVVGNTQWGQPMLMSTLKKLRLLYLEQIPIVSDQRFHLREARAIQIVIGCGRSIMARRGLRYLARQMLHSVLL